MQKLDKNGYPIPSKIETFFDDLLTVILIPVVLALFTSPIAAFIWGEKLDILLSFFIPFWGWIVCFFGV